MVTDSGCTADELFIGNQFSRYLKGFHMMFSSKSFVLGQTISFHYTNAVVNAGKVTPLVWAKPMSRNVERGTFNAAIYDEKGEHPVIDEKTGKEKFRQFRIANCAFTADDLLAMGYCPKCKRPLIDPDNELSAGCEYSTSTDSCHNS